MCTSTTSASCESVQNTPIRTPPTKKLRTQEPDVIISVGSGSSKQEFECYKFILCYASEYFDTMLSLPLREAESSRIELPDKDPEEWKQFYEFIDPATNRNAKITEQNVWILAPWFDEYQMEYLHNQCDEFVSTADYFTKFLEVPRLSCSSSNKSAQQKELENSDKASEKRLIKKIERLLEYHSICEQCALEKSREVALKEIARVMTYCYNLLAKNLDVMEKIINVFQIHRSLMLSKYLSKDVGAIYTEITTAHEMDWSSSMFKAWVQSKLEYAALKMNLEFLPENFNRKFTVSKYRDRSRIKDDAKSILSDLITLILKL